jgi:hypothetical protein
MRRHKYDPLEGKNGSGNLESSAHRRGCFRSVAAGAVFGGRFAPQCDHDVA